MKCNKLSIGVALMLLQLSAEASQNLWQEVTTAQRSVAPQSSKSGRYYQSDTQTLKQILSRAGAEGSTPIDTRIELPNIDGQIEEFQLIEYSMMAPELKAKFPDFKTYKIKGIQDPSASGRISYTPKGFNAMIVSSKGTFFLDQEAGGIIRGYSKRASSPEVPFNCGVKEHNHSHPVSFTANRLAQRTTGSIQVYRLALAANSEYVTAVGGTKPDAFAEMQNTINRVNEIYERDLGIRLELVGNNDAIIYDVDTTKDPYDNSNQNLMLEENQATLDSVIGSGNYDIGHVFGTGGGGIASVSSVCQSGFKAQGTTGLKGASGEAFYIDYVAHEMGHQFGAEHTYNGTTSSCSGNRSQSSAVEPGSGASIMGYAGICGGENLQSNSDAHFHARSISAIDSYTSSNSGSCSTTLTAANPNQPVASAGADHIIPSGTPFMLTATAHDDDVDDTLSYNWYQMDTGAPTSSLNFGEDLGTNPLFRSYLPRSEPVRHFPALGTTLDNLYDYAEVLPCNSRDINFRLAVRDGNGGVGYDNVKVTVDSNSGPFRVTAFNTAQFIDPGDHQISWDVAGTNLAPVNCSSVNISLLTFNSIASTYKETILSTNEINDGFAQVTIPDLKASKARIKIQCESNIFYDITDDYINIKGSTEADTSGNTVFYNSGGYGFSLFTSPASTSCEYIYVPTTETTESNSDSGSGAISLYGLFSMFSLLIIRRRLIV
jgi:hypothetical protein